MSYKYYSTERPVMPGSFPKPQGNTVLNIENFNDRSYVAKIGREAWGYEQIYSMDNLRKAHKNARKGKGWYEEVKEVDANIEVYLKQLQEMLINHTYHTSNYEKFIKKENGKEREIFKLPFERFAIEIPTRSESSVKETFRSAIMRSNRSMIAILIPLKNFVQFLLHRNSFFQQLSHDNQKYSRQQQY